MKSSNMICIIMIMLYLVATALYSNPVSIKLDIRNGASGKGRNPVSFDHNRHENTIGDCAKCHHELSVQNAEYDVNRCSTCHVDKKAGKSPALKDAYHMMCISCHKKVTSCDMIVPLYCGECHNAGKDTGD